IKEVYDQSLNLERVINSALGESETESPQYDILIIDDDTSTNKVLVDFFRLKTYSSKEVSTGREAIEILQKAERWARKKIIITTPNGFFAQGALDENIYQEHLSGWDNHRLRKKGFTVRGMSGAKLFYSGENSTDSLTKNDGVFSNVRFKPKRLFYMLNGLFQIFTYYVPALAFGLFAVKDKK
ncbi:hypothetical protein LCGC14_2438860, partial [marine sediment metagenome]